MQPERGPPVAKKIMKKVRIDFIEEAGSMAELMNLMGYEVINNFYQVIADCGTTYREPFRYMKAEEFGADILENWSHYEKRQKEDSKTHRRRLNIHGIKSYSTVALVIGYYTDENNKTKNIAAALYGHTTTTSRQITTYLKDYGWSDDEIQELKKAAKK